jgi:hypothetical protein
MPEEILVELFEDDADPEQVDAATLAVRRELLELDVDNVVPATAGPAPEGTRGLDVAALGALLVQAGGAAQALASVVTVLRGWMKRSPSQSHRSVRITVGGQSIELTEATSEQQQQLVDRFLASVGGT